MILSTRYIHMFYSIDIAKRFSPILVFVSVLLFYYLYVSGLNKKANGIYRSAFLVNVNDRYRGSNVVSSLSFIVE